MTAISIAQGTDGGIRWLVNDGVSKEPVDFTGWSVRAQVRRNVGSLLPLYEWNSADGTATVGSDGFVTLFWTHAGTSAWTWADGVFSIELTSPAGKVTRLDEGRVTVSPEVTR